MNIIIESMPLHSIKLLGCHIHDHYSRALHYHIEYIPIPCHASENDQYHDNRNFSKITANKIEHLRFLSFSHNNAPRRYFDCTFSMGFQASSEF